MFQMTQLYNFTSLRNTMMPRRPVILEEQKPSNYPQGPTIGLRCTRLWSVMYATAIFVVAVRHLDMFPLEIYAHYPYSRNLGLIYQWILLRDFQNVRVRILSWLWWIAYRR